jgi:hypothetical protein
VNPETAWPGVCRLVVEGKASVEWPQLTREGHFASPASGGPDNSLSGWTRSSGDTGGYQRIPAPSIACFPFPIPDNTHIPGDLLFARKGSSESRQQVVWTTKPAIAYAPGQSYQLCCPDCGALLNRDNPAWHALAPEREALRRFSYRLSQLLVPAIDLEQIVAAWQLAIRDPAHMTVFCTDRLALPKSTTQTLTPAVLEAARGDYNLELRSQNVERAARELSSRSTFSVLRSTFARYAGLDMGDQCWFVARAVDTQAPHLARLLWIEPIAAERVRTRVPELVRLLGIRALCVDAGPLRDLARDVVFMLNGLNEDCVPTSADAAQNIYFRGSRGSWGESAFLQGGPDNSLSGWTRSSEATGGHRDHAHSSVTSCSLRESGQQVVRTTRKNAPHAPTLHWHAASQKWRNVRAIAVEFTQREGQGLRHKLARTQEGRFYPLLAANRDETIERVVQELLPPQVGDPRLIELPDGTAATAPTQRFFLPRATEETRAVLDTYELHLLAGARQERTADGRALRYLDKCENHFLLATAYAALAETLITETPAVALPAIRSMPMKRTIHNRSLNG